MSNTLFRFQRVEFSKARLNRFRGFSRDIQRRFMKGLEQEYLRIMQRNVGSDSGQLKNSLKIKRDGRNKFKVYSNLDYSVIVDQGRKEVVADKGKVLHFKTKYGEDVFTKRVRAVDGQFFIKRTRDEIGTGTYNRLMNRAVKEVGR